MRTAITFVSNGIELKGVLERPNHKCLSYVLFAHCFTCGKDIAAATRISEALVSQGFGVLRFDFTGLGESAGRFEDTNFSSNVDDLVAAADFLRAQYQAPELLIGHSLGGAAVLLAAKRIKEVKTIATIGAPASAEHVKENFSADLSEIQSKGEAEVQLGPRTFKIKKQFLEDIDNFGTTIESTVGKALLILHSPIDTIVSIHEAEKIYKAAKHPKSFMSLDKADHLLSKKEDANYVATIISAWASHYLLSSGDSKQNNLSPGHIMVEEKDHHFTQYVYSDTHQWLADEPLNNGGQNEGPDPYEHLLAGLGACTAMTIRMFSTRKKWPLEHVAVELSHTRNHIDDCDNCEAKSGYIESIHRTIHITGALSEEQKQRLEQVADRCPVHKTLSQKIGIQTIVHFG